MIDRMNILMIFPYKMPTFQYTDIRVLHLAPDARPAAIIAFDLTFTAFS